MSASIMYGYHSPARQQPSISAASILAVVCGDSFGEFVGGAAAPTTGTAWFRAPNLEGSSPETQPGPGTTAAHARPATTPKHMLQAHKRAAYNR